MKMEVGSWIPRSFMRNWGHFWGRQGTSAASVGTQASCQRPRCASGDPLCRDSQKHKFPSCSCRLMLTAAAPLTGTAS